MVSLGSALRAIGVAELALVVYAVLYLELAPFADAAVILLGGAGSLLTILNRKAPIQVAGIAIAAMVIVALLALPSVAFIGAGIIAILVVLFGGSA